MNREQIVKTASDITENLLSVTRMMDNTVEQSAQSLQSLGMLVYGVLKNNLYSHYCKFFKKTVLSISRTLKFVV